MLAGSTAGGKTWSNAKFVHQGKTVKPDRGMHARLSLLSSTNHGASWTATSPRIERPLYWMQPTGRMIETNAGQLVMAVHGSATEADLKATIHSCGLLRSSDGSQSWGDFSWLAHSDHSVFGSLSTTRFNFEGPSRPLMRTG